MTESDWVFDAGRLCVDFVNTCRDRHRGGRELLTSPAALAEWARLAGHSGPGEPDPDRAIRLREAIDRVTRAVTAGTAPDAADVELLNTEAAAAPPPRLEVGRHGRPRRVLATPLLAALAVDAIELVTAEPEIRICAADDCGLRFVDASPKRSRQWCSMARCGNRAKARAHYARRKGKPHGAR
ncbi:putative RNA-binding Zn ribbon-like protein [Prauserella shujinwangii]|uniref:Putative RNA-binding Zn ribbon-like protein n=1 Tax=Prauserella shujinwangii TaxID=1453103 RepID=A0A2T0M1G4_9PSEU|nr:ABATE domain-containing protein [Prauserella shujinwangii]PRX50446.1 putative RNA-binding Zn ribbon-like protein [Prauserella shujinwangii]